MSYEYIRFLQTTQYLMVIFTTPIPTIHNFHKSLKGRYIHTL